jgi:hypothetical protein
MFVNGGEIYSVGKWKRLAIDVASANDKTLVAPFILDTLAIIDSGFHGRF